MHFAWDTRSYFDMTVMFMVGRYCFTFYVGYLCKRHKLVTPAAQLLRDNQLLRVAGGLVSLLLGVYAVYTGQTFQQDRLPPGFNPPSGRHPVGSEACK